MCSKSSSTQLIDFRIKTNSKLVKLPKSKKEAKRKETKVKFRDLHCKPLKQAKYYISKLVVTQIPNVSNSFKLEQAFDWSA